MRDPRVPQLIGIDRYWQITKVMNNYPKVEYSAPEIVMDTQIIHDRFSGLKLMPIMQICVCFIQSTSSLQ